MPLYSQPPNKFMINTHVFRKQLKCQAPREKWYTIVYVSIITHPSPPLPSLVESTIPTRQTNITSRLTQEFEHFPAEILDLINNRLHFFHMFLDCRLMIGTLPVVGQKLYQSKNFDAHKVSVKSMAARAAFNQML